MVTASTARHRDERSAKAIAFVNAAPTPMDAALTFDSASVDWSQHGPPSETPKWRPRTDGRYRSTSLRYDGLLSGLLCFHCSSLSRLIAPSRPPQRARSVYATARGHHCTAFGGLGLMSGSAKRIALVVEDGEVRFLVPIQDHADVEGAAEDLGIGKGRLVLQMAGVKRSCIARRRATPRCG
jgi:hypothetical protein